MSKGKAQADGRSNTRQEHHDPSGADSIPSKAALSRHRHISPAGSPSPVHEDVVSQRLRRLGPQKDLCISLAFPNISSAGIPGLHRQAPGSRNTSPFATAAGPQFRSPPRRPAFLPAVIAASTQPGLAGRACRCAARADSSSSRVQCAQSVAALLAFRQMTGDSPAAARAGFRIAEAIKVAILGCIAFFSRCRRGKVAALRPPTACDLACALAATRRPCPHSAQHAAFPRNASLPS